MRVEATSELESLRNDVLSEAIVNEHLLDDPAALESLGQVSGTMNKKLEGIQVSSLTIVGTETQCVSDITFCHQFSRQPDLKKHIRVLHVSSRVYLRCRFSPATLPNLVKLRVCLGNDDPMYSQVDPQEMPVALTEREIRNPVVIHWMQLDRQYPKTVKSIDVADIFGRHVLHHLLADYMIGNKLVMMKRFLNSRQLQLNVQDEEGISPLHSCFLPHFFDLHGVVRFDVLECVQMLIQAGANPNLEDNIHRTAVHFSTLLPGDAVLKYLHAQGGDLTRPVYNKHLQLPNALSFMMNVAYSSRLEQDILRGLVQDVNHHVARIRYPRSHATLYALWQTSIQYQSNRTSPEFYLLQHQVSLKQHRLTVHPTGYTYFASTFHDLVKRNRTDLVRFILETYPQDEVPLLEPDAKGKAPLDTANENGLHSVFEILLAEVKKRTGKDPYKKSCWDGMMKWVCMRSRARTRHPYMLR